MPSLISKTDKETRDLGRALAKAVTEPLAIALSGDLGAGKTTLVQGMAAGLGVGKEYYVTSPSYNIINEYPADPFRLCHLDLYRLGSPDELDYLGFEDILDQEAVIAVEWPGFLQETDFPFDLEIRFEFDPDYNRIISLFGSGQRGRNLLSRLIL
ncbi:tRNA (adenosine(37)-N6)-threonylcarbamoyltransferase complex ATPase subunit type 1 TsaE [Desulfospira joergensenii]|uniref:tRNA (adenosine(37)-N6)-threonylcarbamoyltransferase complex ATPase subunit type 1 TsaE n=1 Tax=Desulfospira joergensenii TaxID=53329 RepID=UPI0003B67EBD|nr:tRNA (adenosine(37)-N6)-threonylcarbamoyltransferase complex ATPase subunit type 1 TsaE [Desulfospira joergensenii]